ncbi:uncharacterized protein VP01_468g2 [Puccinia sorghi]|uniref:Uncharacterized protein n=1 Tax=Puccinia sorghi TaxID=27349 RepID=A0A0L6UN29_9BASI|nr:uncharacterized protein VP01_468g2 [Puccinia sorghi]
MLQRPLLSGSTLGRQMGGGLRMGANRNTCRAEVFLQWVKAHTAKAVGLEVEGNKEADLLAGDGRKRGVPGPHEDLARRLLTPAITARHTTKMQPIKPLNPKPEMRRFVRRPVQPLASAYQHDVGSAPSPAQSTSDAYLRDPGAVEGVALGDFRRKSDVSARPAGRLSPLTPEQENPDRSTSPTTTAHHSPAVRGAPPAQYSRSSNAVRSARSDASHAPPCSPDSRPTAYADDRTHASDTVSPAYKSHAHLCLKPPCAEHTLLVYRMGSVRYLERCVEEGLTMDFTSTPADPLDSDPRALEPYRAPWRFYQSPSEVKQPTGCIPLPPLAVGEIPLTAESTRGSVASSSRHLVISGCRAYHTRIPVPRRESDQRHITQYAVPMFALDLMEKGSTGYNTFYHRAECPCNTGFSIMALQMSPSSIIVTSSSAASFPVKSDDYTAMSLGADSFTEVTIVGMPYMAPYFYVEGALCKDGTCISRLGVSDYRPDSAEGHVCARGLKLRRAAAASCYSTQQACLCNSKHIRKGRYSAVDALMDASFPPRLGTFNVDCAMSPEVRESLTVLPNKPAVSSMYLDLCTIHLTLQRGPLPPTLVIISQNVVYSEAEAIEICDLYLALSPPASCSNAIIVQNDMGDWVITGGYRALGSEEKVYGPSLRYSTEELLLYLKDLQDNGGCLAVSHSGPDSEEARILNSLYVLAWSVGSEPSCYPTLSLSWPSQDLVLLPVYASGASAYTRVLLTSGPVSPVYPQVPRHLGDLSFYNTYIRGARMRSGRCWDCECIYQLAVRLEMDRLRANPTSYVPLIPRISRSFTVEVSDDLSLESGS